MLIFQKFFNFILILPFIWRAEADNSDTQGFNPKQDENALTQNLSSQFTLKVYSKIMDPLFFFNKSIPSRVDGILPDIFRKIIYDIQKNNHSLYIHFLFTNISDWQNITIDYSQSYDQEQGIISVRQLTPQLDYSNLDISEKFLQENYLFVYPNILVLLIKKIIAQLLYSVIIILVPWFLLNANIMALIFKPKKKQSKYYVKRLISALVILIGNKKTSIGTLIYKIFFLLILAIMLSVMLADFIYIVGNTIAIQTFKNLQEIENSNGWKVLYLQQDPFIEDMLNAHRTLATQSFTSIEKAFKALYLNDKQVLFLSEFQFIYATRNVLSFYELVKISVKEDSYKGYNMIMNKSLPLWFRKNLNDSIINIRLQKVDIDAKSKYTKSIYQNGQDVDSLISSNTTVFLSSLALTLILILIMQISALKRQIYIFYNDIPYNFLKKNSEDDEEKQENIQIKSSKKQQILDPQQKKLLASSIRYQALRYSNTDLQPQCGKQYSQNLYQQINTYHIPRQIQQFQTKNKLGQSYMIEDEIAEPQKIYQLVTKRHNRSEQQQ